MVTHVGISDEDVESALAAWRRIAQLGQEEVRP
jgi:hypothetical protein